MKKHGISEKDLVNHKIVNKETIMNILSDAPKHKTVLQESKGAEIIKEKSYLKDKDKADEKVKAESLQQINLIDNKNYLPQTYFENTTQVDNLMKHIDEINKKHKKNIDIGDFFAKVWI
jgi:hypothetical protein